MTPATATALAPYESDPGVLEATGRAAAVLERAKAIVVKDDATHAEATDLLAECRKGTKGIDTLRRQFVDPLNEHVKNINNFFKRGAAPLEEADRLLAGKRRDYEAKVAEAARKEEERLRKLAEARYERAAAKAEAKGDEAPPLIPLTPTIARPAKTQTTTGGHTVTNIPRHHFEVTDPAAVPREWCCPDEKRIGAAVRSEVLTAYAPPAGIRIWTTMEPTVR